MTAQEKLLNLLGLAYKSGKTVCGDFACENYLKKHNVPIMFLASDGGGDNSGKYRMLAGRKSIRIVDIFTKEELGGAVGKGRNVVILLTDRGFAQAIDKVLRMIE